MSPPTIRLPGRLQQSPASVPSDQFRVIAFGIGPYTFALPMGAIAKVIHCPPLYTPGLGNTRLIHLEQQIIRILDLHEHIASSPQINTPVAPPEGDHTSQNEDHPQPRFLVVARQGNGEWCGIPVDTPPDLLELTRSQIQELPPSSQHRNAILSLARFIAVLPPSPAAASQTPSSPSEAPPESTLLLLDLSQTIAQLQPPA